MYRCRKWRYNGRNISAEQMSWEVHAQQCHKKHKNVKSCLRRKADSPALISISLALSQTLVYTASSPTSEYCSMPVYDPAIAGTHWQSLRLPTEGWPGWVDLAGWLTYRLMVTGLESINFAGRIHHVNHYTKVPPTAMKEWTTYSSYTWWGNKKYLKRQFASYNCRFITHDCEKYSSSLRYWTYWAVLATEPLQLQAPYYGTAFHRT